MSANPASHTLDAADEARQSSGSHPDRLPLQHSPITRSSAGGQQPAFLNVITTPVTFSSIFSYAFSHRLLVLSLVL